MKVKLNCSVCSRLIFERRLSSLLLKKHTCPECNTTLDTVISDRGKVWLISFAAIVFIITALFLQLPLVLKMDVSITLILSLGIFVYLVSSLLIISKNIETKRFNPMVRSSELKRGLLRNKRFLIIASLIQLAGGFACYYFGGLPLSYSLGFGLSLPLISGVLIVADSY